MAKKKEAEVQDASEQKEEETKKGSHQMGETDGKTREEEKELVPEEERSSPAGEEASPEVSVEEVEALRASLDESEEKAQEYLEGWQRSRAEFANYKKRIMKEREDMYEQAKGDVIKNYLDISDDLGRALQDWPESGEGAAWAEGIELIYKKLQLKLEKEGVKTMEAEGEMFDPNYHEAVFKEEHEDFESGQVIEVLQEGYVLGDRILRPALVRVAA